MNSFLIRSKMRTVFLVVLVVFGAQIDGQHSTAKAKSPLALIIDDLSILARVTNAIALQAAVHRGNLRLHDVAADLLHIRTDHFATILATNTSFCISTIDEVFEKSRDFVRNDPGARRRLKLTREVVGVLARAESRFEVLKAAENVDTKQFINAIKNSSETSKGLFCRQQVLESFVDFYKMEKEEMLARPFTTRKALNGMKTNFGELMKCIRRFRTFSSNLSNSTLVHSMEDLKKLNELHAVVKWFHGRRRARLVDLPTRIRELKTDWHKTTTIWHISNASSAQLALRRLYEAFYLTSEFQVQKDPRKFTAAFRRVADLLKVSQDVNSLWFKTNVAMGKSTKRLEDALTTFFEVSETSQNLGTAWGRSYSHMLTSNQILGNSGLNFKAIARFQNAKIAGNGFDELERKFSTCFALSEIASDSDIRALEDFPDNFMISAQLMGYVRRMREEPLWLVQNKNLRNFEDLMHFLSSQNISAKRWPETLYSVRTSSDYQLILPILKRIVYIHRLQSGYEESVAKVNESMVNFSDFLQHSNAWHVMECIQNSSIGTARAETQHILDFLLNVTQFADEKSYSATKTFLENTARVQNEMTRVEMVVRAKRNESNEARHLVLSFRDSASLAQSLGRGVSALDEVKHVDESRKLIWSSANLTDGPQTIIRDFENPWIIDLWIDSNRTLKTFLDDVHSFVSRLDAYRAANFTELSRVFEEVKKVHGLLPLPGDFGDLYEHLKYAGHQETALKFLNISHLYLDFSGFESDFTGGAACLSLLRANFDELFGLNPKKVVGEVKSKTVFKQEEAPIVTVIAICVGALVLILLAAAFGYAFTKGGRKRYRTWYLYYFPDMDEFERRWRYSLFLDRMNGKNVLLEAVTVANPVNTLKALKRGAFVDVFDKFGNTPLHVAANLGYDTIVEMLIKHGADRTIHNARNRTAEQVIPANYRSTCKEKADNYERIDRMFEKYRKKTFRIVVPEQFPTSSFQIYLEPKTDGKLVEMFMSKFEAITTLEPSPKITHVVVNTNADGILETDDVSLLAWIFNGAIIVNEKWMSDCLTDAKMLASDEKYLVDRVRYKGQVYENAVLPWSRALAKGAMPFLYGVHLVVVMKECANLSVLYELATTHGALVLDEFPVREKYNAGAHPYLHTNLGPIFILHDAKSDLSAYRTDPLFTVLTEPEFIAFMLRRDVHVETTTLPIPVLVQDSV
ncbi:unnamed protein product [Caenorhabditis sp. 36 PRJEB53466]|nr:unnamed protein product [Caenorhabditis sp. 36 PRJEB53466]